jgi:tetratricopeptide (TPR) repeat protein
MAEAFYELATDKVTFAPILYPYKLYGRFYEFSTLEKLLDTEQPLCPFTRSPFTKLDIEKPTLFERHFFDLVANHSRVTKEQLRRTKEEYISFLRRQNLFFEAAELGDNESMLRAALICLSDNNLPCSKRWALKAAVSNNLFAVDVLGHIAMLEKDFEGAHDHFVRCWSAPKWNLKDRTAYFIAECYYARNMFRHALRWVNRAMDLSPKPDCECITLCAQIFYLQSRYDKCIAMAEKVRRKNKLGAFIYAMCAYRKLGKFLDDLLSFKKASAVMHELEEERYPLAVDFCAGVQRMGAIERANRNDFRR